MTEINLPPGYAFTSRQGHFTGAAIGELRFNGELIRTYASWEPEDIEADALDHARQNEESENA